jgi:hypothetical protein
MGIIKDLAFLEKDLRFRELLSKDFQKDFDWYLNFDKEIRILIKDVLDRINSGMFTGIYNLLEKISGNCTKEYRFIAACRIAAVNNKLALELRQLNDVLRRLGTIKNIFDKTGHYIGQGKMTAAITELNKAFDFL